MSTPPAPSYRTARDETKEPMLDLAALPVPLPGFPPLPLPRSQYLSVLSWTTDHGQDLEEVCLIAKRYDPDLVVLGELCEEQIENAARMLGMDAHPSAGTDVTAHRTVIFVRPAGQLVALHNHQKPNSRDPRIPRANVEFTLRQGTSGRVPGSFTVAGLHLSYCSPTERLIAAENVSNLQSQPRLIIGDFNEDPAGEQIDRSRDANRAHWHDRSFYVHGAGRITATRVDEDLTTQGLNDIARLLNTEEAMRPTSSTVLRAPGQSPAGRGCRVYADEPLALAAVHLEVLAGYDDVSDHHPILTVFHLPALRDAVTAAAARRDERRQQLAADRVEFKTARIAREIAAGLR
ncbi:endonuclease/exonuclease/phosphatase family protein [Kitasatospora sp. NRRL B-11411]|uniref:endonuclease/exonuclease/phosphatase family protein n=1 Tax=Kitasatospora sp. NRRL B-11411 TaxID=1463822 RepID=UPI0012FF30C3|nr:endonuclease/exonuclease/phosphatase family protein [Kitasatospora sp. NRRL B-11411]